MFSAEMSAVRKCCWILFTSIVKLFLFSKPWHLKVWEMLFWKSQESLCKEALVFHMLDSAEFKSIIWSHYSVLYVYIDKNKKGKFFQKNFLLFMRKYFKISEENSFILTLRKNWPQVKFFLLIEEKQYFPDLNTIDEIFSLYWGKIYLRSKTTFLSLQGLKV
jgi:hypothetical protein